MNINDFKIKNAVDQKQVFEDFVKYCKFYGLATDKYGSQILNVTDGIHKDWNFRVKYTPKESGLGTLDTITCNRLSCGTLVSVDQLLKAGQEMLGSNAFYTKEEVQSLQLMPTKNKQLSVVHKQEEQGFELGM